MPFGGGAAAALIALASSVCAVTQTPESRAAEAPDAVFVGADGARLSLAKLRQDGPVVLLFMRGFTGDFACFYCGAQTRDYVAAYRRFRAAGAEVVMVLPGATDVAGYLRKVGTADEDNPEPNFATPYRVVLDPQCRATKAFGVPANAAAEGTFPVDQPATVVIDRAGRIVFEHHGKNPSDRPSADAVLKALAGGRAESGPAESRSVANARSAIAWTEYEAGVAASKSGGRPLLVDLYAVW